MFPSILIQLEYGPTVFPSILIQLENGPNEFLPIKMAISHQVLSLGVI